MNKITLSGFCLLLFSCQLFSQQTVGIFLNTPQSFNGYTLFSNNEISYLIDNCGFKVNIWESDYKPGESVYLLENGELLRTARVSGNFSGGGLGGRFELFDWGGDLLWSYEYANNTVHAHHDIEPLPNGNFLALAFEKHTQSDAKQNGRAYNGEVWSERIIEIETVGNNQANIVWEWRLWDHLIQDFDASKANYGAVSAHPGLVDINYIGEGEDTNGDWIHANAIAYNAELDQIAISSRNFSEIWIIDHSTTTAEAAGHSGGNAGKGGDLLYRYGNPQTYKRGNTDDQKFTRQHDIRWIPDGFPNEGKLMVFNNDDTPNASSIEIWEPPLNDDGSYDLENGQAFGPEQVDWQYTASDFYSEIMSGAYALPNGNVLICEGETGRLFEVTLEKELVWEYINPVNRNGNPIAQGGTIHFNEVFRASRYAPDYEAFDGKDLTPGAPVEINPWDLGCEIYESSVAAQQSFFPSPIRILGNPFSEFLVLESNLEKNTKLHIYDGFGSLINTPTINFGLNQISLKDLPDGLYFAKLFDNKGISFSETIIKVGF